MYKRYIGQRSSCQGSWTKENVILIVLACIVSATIILCVVLLLKSSVVIPTQRVSVYQKMPVPGENHIIFIESSCADIQFQPPKGKGLLMSTRQACSIESAARSNPNSSIYFLYTCPVSITQNFIEESKEFVFRLFQYPNLRIWQLELDDYFEETPLEHFYKSGGWNSSKWPIIHASDILRYLSLWKFGGTYLDLDIIVLRPINDLGSNFAGAETNNTMGNAVLNFGFDRVGRDIARGCLEDISTNFKGNIWAHNGPTLVTRVLAKICNTTQTARMTPDRCSGFTCYPQNTFYPIFYDELQLFFDESFREKAIQQVQGSHMVHLWNSLTKGMPVTVGSQQSLALIAKEHCPAVYTHCGSIL